MHVKVHLFASLREKAGKQIIYLDLDEGATVTDAWASLCLNARQLETYRDRVLIALNRRYVSGNATLSDGDELALFPPVSGG